MIDNMPSCVIIRQVSDGAEVEIDRIDMILGRIDRSLNSNAFRVGITIVAIVNCIVAIGLVCVAANMLLR